MHIWVIEGSWHLLSEYFCSKMLWEDMVHLSLQITGNRPPHFLSDFASSGIPAHLSGFQYILSLPPYTMSFVPTENFCVPSRRNTGWMRFLFPNLHLSLSFMPWLLLTGDTRRFYQVSVSQTFRLCVSFLQSWDTAQITSSNLLNTCHPYNEVNAPKILLFLRNYFFL